MPVPSKPRPSQTRRQARPALEPLELRAVPATFTVTNTGDNGGVNPDPFAGTGTLRQAILDANATPNVGGPDRIEFAILTSDTGYRPATSSFRIRPQAELPRLVDSVVLDGYSQPGASPNHQRGIGRLGEAPAAPPSPNEAAVLKIELDGTEAAGATYGLILHPNVTVKGLVINNFAVGVIAGDDSTVEGCYVGTDVTGTTVYDEDGNHLGNHKGIVAHGDRVLIGGATPEARNLITGNWSDVFGGGNDGIGVFLEGQYATVQGNFIGTDRTGTTAYDAGGKWLGDKTANGIDVRYDQHAVIRGNLISGGQYGVTNNSSGAGALLVGNFIGTDVTGTRVTDDSGRPVGNVGGLFLGSAAAVGGTGVGEGNLIWGNTGGNAVGNCEVKGNYFGMDVLGHPGPPGGALFVVSNCVIGGSEAGAGNEFATGVQLGYAGGVNNRVERNHFLQGGLDLFLTSGNVVRSNTFTGGQYGVGLNQGHDNLVLSNSFAGMGVGVLVFSSNNVIEDNTLSASDTGIKITGGNGNVVRGNTVAGATLGVFVYVGGQNLIESNTLTGGSIGVVLGDFYASDSASDNNIVRANTITGNSYGVLLYSGAVGNQITQNSIFANGVSGIALNPGANNGQAAPALTAAYANEGVAVVTGSVTSVPNSTVTVEFFANVPGDLEGRTFLGSWPVATDGSGHGAFTAVLLAAPPAGQGLITATATDAAGNSSTFSAGVTATALTGTLVTLLPDPANPGQTALLVVGTPSADRLVLTPSGGVTVHLNGAALGTYQPTSRVVVYALGGDDDVQVAGGITLPAWLYGGAGNDRLKGGGGTNVLVGGAGDDLLVGGDNRDLLIGGTGADRIVGNAQDDILVAGSTAFDGNETALAAVLAEWTSGRSYAVRVANLNGTGSGAGFDARLNGNTFLRVTGSAATTTVFDDGAADVLTGSTGQDWFLANLAGTGVLDRVTDLTAAEFANDLTFIQGP